MERKIQALARADAVSLPASLPRLPSLQFRHRPYDPLPDDLSHDIALGQQFIGPLSRDDRRLLAMLLDEDIPLTGGIEGFNITSGYDMVGEPPEYGLEFLLAFDGRIHHLEGGYSIKFEIKRIETTKERPHGLSYAITLHAPNGTRLVGFDNAHRVPARGSRFTRRPEASDHWHRTEIDPGMPYAFKDADTLLQDFFREVRRILADRGIPETVVKVQDERK